jgi:hypothetical protein
MRLKQDLTLEQVWLAKVGIEPTEGETKTRLEFRADLTPDIAESLGCRELVYAGNVPRSGVDSMVLEGEERNCEVHLEREKISMRLLTKSVGHAKVVFEGTGPQLKFQVVMEGYAITAAELAVELKNDPVKLVFKPAQMELPLTEKAEAGKEADANFMEEMGIGDKPVEETDGKPE